MTFLEENFEYIVTTILLIIVIFIFIIFRYNIYLAKFFSNKKFRVNSKYEFEPSNGSKYFALNIFNNNVNDTRIIAFGYIYKNHNIDYYKAYLIKNNLPDTTKVIIPSRDCISTKIDAMNLKKIISDMNKGKRKVTKMQTFVSDSQGLTFKSNARVISNQIAYLLKEDYLKSKELKKELRKKMKLEKREILQQKRIERRLKWKEKYDKFKLRIKKLNIFRTKNKN